MDRRNFIKTVVLAIAGLVLGRGKVEDVIQVTLPTPIPKLDNFGILAKDVKARIDSEDKDIICGAQFYRRVLFDEST